MVLVTVTTVLMLAIIWAAMIKLNPAQSTTFAAVAVDTHQRNTQGRLPLELRSDSPELISSWFEGKVSFDLGLPDYPEEQGRNKLYQLEGARLIVFNNDYSAYLSYKTGVRDISLMVAPSSVAKPSGGEKIPSQDLIIHYDTIDELKAITWSHRDLTYALLSNLEERGQQSRLVCHRDSNINLGANFDS